MLVSTTVVSTRRRRPRTTRRSRPRATSRANTSLSTGSSRRRPSRISVFASGTRSPSIRQKARYTKLPRTSRSHSSKLQSWRCLRTSIRRTTAAGVPSRPRRRLCGWRWARASVTRSTRTSSSSRASICRRVESQSLSASGKSTSTRLRCRYARRTMAPPVRPPGLRGATRELRSRATCEIALLSHHHASRVPSSTNNCAFGWVFRAAARTNTGCPRPNSHREVTNRQDSPRLGRDPRCAFGPLGAGSQYAGSVTICWDVLLLPRDPELLHSRFERGGLQAEVPCGSPLTADAPPCQLEHAQDMLPFDLLERPGTTLRAPAAGRHWPPAQVELGTRAEDRRPLDHVFKLANIARPGIGLEHLHDCRRDIRDPLPQSWAILQRQVPHQEGNIFCPFAERR